MLPHPLPPCTQQPLSAGWAVAHPPCQPLSVGWATAHPPCQPSPTLAFPWPTHVKGIFSSGPITNLSCTPVGVHSASPSRKGATPYPQIRAQQTPETCFMNMEYQLPPWTGQLFRALLEAAAICLPPVPPGLFLTTELDFRSSSSMWCLFQDLPKPQVPPAKRSSGGFIQCSLMPGDAPRALSVLATLLGVSVSPPPRGVHSMLSHAWGCSASSIRPGYPPRGQRLTSPQGGSLNALSCLGMLREPRPSWLPSSGSASYLPPLY